MVVDEGFCGKTEPRLPMPEKIFSWTSTVNLQTESAIKTWQWDGTGVWYLNSHLLLIIPTQEVSSQIFTHLTLNPSYIVNDTIEIHVWPQANNAGCWATIGKLTRKYPIKILRSQSHNFHCLWPMLSSHKVSKSWTNALVPWKVRST